jgi:DNA-binding response OmpR family regulator
VTAKSGKPAVSAASPQPRSGRPVVVVAEDDEANRVATGRFFERMGYDVVAAADGPAVLRIVASAPVDLVLLDLGLPGIDGTEVLSSLRRSTEVPVIVCSGRDTEEARIRGLDLGADDYVVKPFSLPELEARVRAVLRRGTVQAHEETLDFGDLVIDRTSRRVMVGGEPVELTRREFDLLAFLANAPGHVYSREELLEHVWGSTEAWQDRATVTEHIRRVRSKVERDPNRPRWIQTARGVGYRFDADGSDSGTTDHGDGWSADGSAGGSASGSADHGATGSADRSGS